MKFKVVTGLVVVALLNVGWAQDFNWRQFEGIAPAKQIPRID